MISSLGKSTGWRQDQHRARRAQGVDGRKAAGVRGTRTGPCPRSRPTRNRLGLRRRRRAEADASGKPEQVESLMHGVSSESKARHRCKHCKESLRHNESCTSKSFARSYSFYQFVDRGGGLYLPLSRPGLPKLRCHTSRAQARVMYAETECLLGPARGITRQNVYIHLIKITSTSEAPFGCEWSSVHRLCTLHSPPLRRYDATIRMLEVQ